MPTFGNMLNTATASIFGNLPAIYVSQSTGSDTTGTGIPTNPYATIGHALTVAGSPSVPTSIVLMDNSAYIENVAINSNQLSIYGPQATILASSGDTITLGSGVTGFFITALGLQASGGNVINNSFGAFIVCNTSILAGDIIVTNGELIAQTIIYNGNITQSGTGQVQLLCLSRGAGTNTGNVYLLSAAGSTNTNFTVNGFSASGLGYPSSDGSANNVMITNGAGALSLQDVSLTGAVVTTPASPQTIGNFSLSVTEGVIAGSNAVAGTIQVLDGTTGNPSVEILATPNAAGTDLLTITNAAYGQSTTMTIPDPAVASSTMPVLNATSFGSGNLPIFTGTNGTLQDSGVAPAVLASTSWVIPWTSWQYFVQGGGGGNFYWCPSTAQNGPGFTGTSNRDFGTVNFNAPVNGTYQFTIMFSAGSASGIATVAINSVVTTLDTYDPGQIFVTWVWSQVLTAGTYGIDLSSFTKNPSSSDYWLAPLYNGMSIQLL
jgi:hypothetical protein